MRVIPPEWPRDMPGIVVGSVSVEVVPSAESFVPKLRAQLTGGASAVGDELGRQIGQRIGAQITQSIKDALGSGFKDAPVGPATESGRKTGGAFADAFKAKVTAALRDLPNPRVGLDATDLDAELADIRERLAALGDVRVGVDLSATEALAELDRLKVRIDELGARSPDINVRVDAARASAELAAVQAEVSALDGENAEVAVSDGGSAAAVAGDMGGLATVLIGLAPLAVPIGAALVAGLAGVATTALAAAGGIGVLALGVSGVSSAVKLLGQEQQATATDAAKSATASVSSAAAQAAAAASVKSATEALANARQTADQQAIRSAEQVATARQSLADTERRADQQIVSAQQQVVQALYAEGQADQQLTNAQQALNDAREQALRDLQTYANSVTDANLSVQQSTIDVTNAQKQYQADLANPSVTPLQLQQDALNIAKAQEQLLEAQQQLVNATQDNNKAQAEGVDGAPGVVSATDQVNQAKHAQLVATQQLAAAIRSQKQTELDAAESIKKAQQSLADAIRNQADQQRQSAYAIQSAQNSVANAMRAVQSASDSAGTAGSSALAKIKSQLDKVNPATLQFAHFVVDTLEPAFNRIKSVAAAGLLPGVEAGLKALTPLIGPLTKFVGDLATTMGHLFTQASKALTGPFWVQFFAWVSSIAGPTLTQFVHAMENLGKGFAGLLEGFGPVTNLIGKGLVELTGKFADFGAKAGTDQNSGFAKFIAYIRQNGPTLIDLLEKLGGIFGKLLVGLAPLGSVMLKVADAIAKALDSMSPTEILAIVGAIGALVFILVGGPASFAVAVVALVAIVTSNWGAIKGAIQDALDGIKTAALAVADWFTGPFVDFFTGAWSDITGAFTAADNWISSSFYTAWGAVLGILEAPVDAAKTAIGALIGVGGTILGFFSAAWQWVRDTFSTVWGGVTGVLKAPFSLAHTVIKGLLGVGGDILGVFSDAWHWVSNTWSSIWGGITDIITSPLSTAKGVLTGLWSDIKSDAKTFVHDMGKALSALEDVFKAPIRVIVKDVIDDGLIGAWNWIAGKLQALPGVPNDLKITPFQLPKGFAVGGVLPGYAPGRDSVMAMLSPGEAILRPEVARAIGANRIDSWNASAAAGGMPRFAAGGIVKGWGNPISGIKSGFGVLGNAASGLTGALADPVGWLTGKIHDVLGGVTKFLNAPWGKLVAGVPEGVGGELGSIAGNLFGKLVSGIASTVGGAVGGLFGPIKTPDVVNNLLLGHDLASARGWTADNGQLPALVELWTKESGWSQYADTRKSGLDPANASVFAYGIAQARPATKYPLAGRPADLGGSSDPATQIKWGLDYIAQNYGSPIGAMAHENQFDWYDAGGLLPPGPSLVYNGTRMPELVAPQRTFEQVIAGASGGASGPMSFEGDLYLDSGEFLGRVRGEANAIIDKRVDGASHASRQGVPGGALGALSSPHARAASRN